MILHENFKEHCKWTKKKYYILVGIWVIACIQEPSHHFLQTSRRQRIFMLVLRDNSLYSKQLSLFCPISACADGAGLTSRDPTFGEFVPRLGISATFGEKFGELRYLGIF